MTNEEKTAGKDRSTDEKFVPSIEEWERLFVKWREKMEKSLWKSGSPRECEDAVQEAFLTVLGLSLRHRLSEPLTPKSEGCWYAFVRWHARGILSHEHQRAKRLVEFREYDPSVHTDVDDGWSRPVLNGSPYDVAPSACEDMDMAWLRREVRTSVAEICREAGVRARNVRAFVRNVLDGLSGKEVVDEIGGDLVANNLYAIKHRIMGLLRTRLARLKTAYDELLAA